VTVVLSRLAGALCNESANLTLTQFMIGFTAAVLRNIQHKNVVSRQPLDRTSFKDTLLDTPF
jgi:hypothetical protein